MGSVVFVGVSTLLLFLGVSWFVVCLYFDGQVGGFSLFSVISHA